jgi:hypothetical protein
MARSGKRSTKVHQKVTRTSRAIDDTIERLVDSVPDISTRELRKELMRLFHHNLVPSLSGIAQIRTRIAPFSRVKQVRTTLDPPDFVNRTVMAMKLLNSHKRGLVNYIDEKCVHLEDTQHRTRTFGVFFLGEFASLPRCNVI